MGRKSYNEGDVFLIPMHDGRFAVCQVICALRYRFKKAFSFGVMSIQRDETVSLEDGEFLVYSYGKRKSSVIFTSPKLLKDGTWSIVGNIPLTPAKKELQCVRDMCITVMSIFEVFHPQSTASILHWVQLDLNWYRIIC